MNEHERDQRGHDGGCARNDLTDEQAEEARRLIDDAGGDTWDEGDYNWRFTSVRCDFAAQVCSLDMIVADHDADAASPRRFQRSGNIYGVTRYEDLVTETKPRGRWVTQEFHNKVADLIEYLEKTIPRP